MARKQTIITDEIYSNALEVIKEIPKGSRLHYRLNAIISGKEHGISHVSKILNIMPETLRSWVRRFSNGGILDLNDKQKTGRKLKTKEEHIEKIKQWIKEDSQITIQSIVIKLKEECSLDTNKSTVHRVIKKLNFSYITPRAKHYKQDQTQLADFKKKITFANPK